MKPFIIKIIATSIALVIIGWLVFSLFLPEYFLPIIPIALLFFLIMTILVHAYQLKLAKKDMGKFSRSTMLVTFFKLIVYSVFAVAYIAFYPENAIPFVISLMIIYVVFSFIEVAEISKISKK